jgi:hypothetical protein
MLAYSFFLKGSQNNMQIKKICCTCILSLNMKLFFLSTLAWNSKWKPLSLNLEGVIQTGCLMSVGLLHVLFIHKSFKTALPHKIKRGIQACKMKF